VFHRAFPSNVTIQFCAPDKGKIVKLAQCGDKPKPTTTYGYQLRSSVTLLREKRLAGLWEGLIQWPRGKYFRNPGFSQCYRWRLLPSGIWRRVEW